jgi:hypothetical protein
VASITLRKRKSARYHRSGPLDCLRRGSHACDRTTFTLWQWRSVVYGGTGVVLFTLIVGFLEWKAQRRERAQDKADKAELIRLLQDLRSKIEQSFRRLRPTSRQSTRNQKQPSKRLAWCRLQFPEARASRCACASACVTARRAFGLSVATPSA